MKISEAEINSSTRRFLLGNNFKFLSTTNHGEKFYYRIGTGAPPFYKQPDCLVYRDNIVIIWEEKIKYYDLFSHSKEKVSDIQKLLLLLDSPSLKEDFLKPISIVLGIPSSEIILLGGVNSIEKRKIDKSLLVPLSLIHLSTTIENYKAKIRVEHIPDLNINIFTKELVVHLL